MLDFLKNKLPQLVRQFSKHIVCAFILIQTVLLFLALFCNVSSYVNFSIIAVCFFTSIIFVRQARFNFFITFAVMFTLISDFFLVLLLPNKDTLKIREIAVAVFCCAQICYFCYLVENSSGQKLQTHVMVRILVCFASLIVPMLVLKSLVNYLVLITMFYFANLLINCIYAFIDYKKSPLFAWGLLFFILCDIFVGFQQGYELGVLGIEQSSFIYKLFFAPFNFIWLFYTISQCLIVLSMRYNNVPEKGRPLREEWKYVMAEKQEK